MRRRWFWPLFLAANLVLCLAGSLLGAIGIVWFALWRDDFRAVPYGYYIDPWLFVVAGVLSAIAVALFVLASRVR